MCVLCAAASNDAGPSRRPSEALTAQALKWKNSNRFYSCWGVQRRPSFFSEHNKKKKGAIAEQESKRRPPGLTRQKPTLAPPPPGPRLTVWRRRPSGRSVPGLSDEVSGSRWRFSHQYYILAHFLKVEALKWHQSLQRVSLILCPFF